MTNGVMCFPLGVEEGAAGALTGGDVDFSFSCLRCLCPSLLLYISTRQFGIKLKCVCISPNKVFSYFVLNVTLQWSE